jgi:hypothetical protein
MMRIMQGVAVRWSKRQGQRVSPERESRRLHRRALTSDGESSLDALQQLEDHCER